MFIQKSQTMPLILTQAVFGILAGIMLGIVARIAPEVVAQFEYHSWRGFVVVAFALLGFIAISIHFIVNGHIRAFADEDWLVRLYGPQLSATKVKVARIMFWPSLGAGLLVGLTARLSLAFGPF
ncbi:hypothetical protein [uncultured Litoreibacter sp.]|uniref:hypothetical protein n=1 Tax=uncultured Litoreibacter sp. TaxID=1392394 RepID=UPI00260969C4|nr:hypothetical protein [uncultured Litoreibacter sp.]